MPAMIPASDSLRIDDNSLAVTDFAGGCTFEFMSAALRVEVVLMGLLQGCQMAKFDPFLSLDCARVEGVDDHNERKL